MTIYSNPLTAAWQGHPRIDTCSDPSILDAQDRSWYVYCSSGPLDDQDRTIHLLPIFRSSDLVHWTYAGDALTTVPAWVGVGAELRGPDDHFFDGTYFLYYAATETAAGGSAIGVLTSPRPTGPWVDSGGPVIEPHAAPCCPQDKMSAYDPSVIVAGSQKYIFYGSFFGGVQVRRLSADGLHSDPASQVQITTDNMYEAPDVLFHAGLYYLFVSSSTCCNGPLTGYSIFVGRSNKVLGPYLDRSGQALTSSQTGGSPVLSMNGDRWVGTGSNSVFADFSGQTWMLYQAVDRRRAFVAGSPTKHHLLMDPLDWLNGWPIVRGGRGASANKQPAPAARDGARTAYRMRPAPVDRLGPEVAGLSDEFNGAKLGPQWRWLRAPARASIGFESGAFHMATEQGDLAGTRSASVLREPAPPGNFVVETRVKLNLPPAGCCFNDTQAGLVIYKDDGHFVKLTVTSSWDTRLTEFGKEQTPGKAGGPSYGNTRVGPPGEWTWLRMVARAQGSEEHYRAYTSRDGRIWERGGVWSARFGTDARIGLVAMGGRGFVASFDYVRVYRLQ